MSIFVEDSPRAHQAGWIIDAYQDGICAGAVVTPFATPYARHAGPGKKPSVRDRAQALISEGVPVWFDPTTHALQMGGVGDFRFYDEYDLWGGARGDITTHANRRDHLDKVFDLQDALQVQHLAPTILLHTGLSGTSRQALELAQDAVTRDPSCWLSVAGTASFWASGGALDAHVGALAQLEPAGWFLTVVRPLNTIPVEAEIEEVHGLCRTTRALSEDSSVHISHGDVAALPAVAAGATSVGSGWDKRQRVCSATDYAPRGASGGGGSWYERPTLRLLLGALTPNEAAVLGTRDASRAARLGGLPAPGPKEAFLHHLGALSRVIDDLQGQADPEQRYRDLVALYSDAMREWPAVEGITSCDAGSNWIKNLQLGLSRYGATEGW